jgi:PadR family transcriptional regulator PadR
MWCRPRRGPHRKYYAINDAGRAQLAASTGTWGSFTDAMDKLLGAGGEQAA